MRASKIKRRCNQRLIRATVLLLLTAVVSIVLGQDTAAEDNEILLSEVPERIRAIMKGELPRDADIEDIKLDTKDDKNVYKVDAQAGDGSELELDITEGGMIVKRERTRLPIMRAGSPACQASTRLRNKGVPAGNRDPSPVRGRNTLKCPEAHST
jgi:hypothetical protein